MEEELAAVHELHDHVQALLVLKGVLQAHDEGVIELLEDFSLDYIIITDYSNETLLNMIGWVVLTSDAGDLISLHQELLKHGLHRVDLLSDVVFHEVDLAVGAAADRPQDREVTLLHRRPL